MKCDICGEDADPPNVKEIFSFQWDDWVYAHKRCPKKKDSQT